MSLDIKKINIDASYDIFIDEPFKNQSKPFSLYIVLEPEAVAPQEKYIITYWTKYTHILTYNKNILKNCPNAQFMPHGMCWILESQYTNIDPRKKQFSVSMGLSHKKGLEGHAFRHRLFQAQHSFSFLSNGLSCDFYINPKILEEFPYPNPVLGKNLEDKFAMLETYQYHIVIENSKQINYFTEKLCDALMCECIPIYWGCPNIHEFFDTTGWILLESESDLEVLCSLEALLPETYEQYRETILKNKNRCLSYTDIYKTINQCIESFPINHTLKID